MAWDTRPKYDFDIRLDPSYDPWAPGPTEPTLRPEPPVPAALRVPGEPCPGAGCAEVIAPVRVDTRPALAPFCVRCRHRGVAAIGRGFTTEDRVEAYLCNERLFGKPLSPRAHPTQRPTLGPGRESLAAAARRKGMSITTLHDRAWAQGLRVTREGLARETWDAVAEGWTPRARRTA